MRCVVALQKRPDPEHQAQGTEIGETWCLFQPGLKVWSNPSGLMAGPSTPPCPGREEDEEEEEEEVGNGPSTQRTSTTARGCDALISTSYCYI